MAETAAGDEDGDSTERQRGGEGRVGGARDQDHGGICENITPSFNCSIRSRTTSPWMGSLQSVSI